MTDRDREHQRAAVFRLEGREEGDWLHAYLSIESPQIRREVAERAARLGLTEALTVMLARGLDLDGHLGGRSTLLAVSAGKGTVESVRFLLARGADTGMGLPLVNAAFGGHLEAVRLLLEAGADPDQANPGFPTALGTARARGDGDMEALLLQYGASKEVGGEPSEVVLRHGPATAPAKPDPSHLSALRAALGDILGNVERAQTFDGALPLELAAVPPAPPTPWWTVFTLGMSGLETTSQHAPEPRRSELTLRLPADWDIDQALSATGAPRWRWPIDQLVHLARLPHQYGTSLVPGDTVPNGDPPEAFDASTTLSGWLLLPDTIATAEPLVVELSSKRIHVLACYPLHTSEMQAKLRHGLGGLMEQLAATNPSPALDPDRAPVV